MKNYTLTISKVLNEWLDDSGLDVKVVTVQMCDEAANLGYDTFYRVHVRWIRPDGLGWQAAVMFAQSELDAQAQSDRDVKRTSYGNIDRDTVPDLIRARLEKEVG